MARPAACCSKLMFIGEFNVHPQDSPDSTIFPAADSTDFFRPSVTSILAKTVGRVNLEAPAVGLTAMAYWARFSRWCSTHPTPKASNGKNGKGRSWLYRVGHRAGVVRRGSRSPISSSVYTAAILYVGGSLGSRTQTRGS